jgi:hypothetical protein
LLSASNGKGLKLIAKGLTAAMCFAVDFVGRVANSIVFYGVVEIE